MTSKAQSQPKQTNLNHFVARFTSRPWLLGTNQFYKLSTDKTGVQATPAGPRNWGGEENLYSQDVEDAFEKIEDKLAACRGNLKADLARLTTSATDGQCGCLLRICVRQQLFCVVPR
jgi:hypothetical protein